MIGDRSNHRNLPRHPATKGSDLGCEGRLPQEPESFDEAWWGGKRQVVGPMYCYNSVRVYQDGTHSLPQLRHDRYEKKVLYWAEVAIKTARNLTPANLIS